MALHFLGQENRLSVPDYLFNREGVVGWGQDYVVYVMVLICRGWMGTQTD